jgi:hypothetical protein
VSKTVVMISQVIAGRNFFNEEIFLQYYLKISIAEYYYQMIELKEPRMRLPINQL